MNALAQQIADRIAEHGPMSVAQFMQHALYDSEHGYYSRSLDQIGRRGDFITSVSVGSLFGELLAFQFARWLERIVAEEHCFQCVEAGAHDGQLASDTLQALEATEPWLFEKLQYWVVEPSPLRQREQQKRLDRFSNVRWFKSFADFPHGISGVIFSNELLDAMPVHVFRWSATARHWNELGVGVSHGQLTWVELPWEALARPKLPHELLEVLPDGYTMEVSTDAIGWWEKAAHSLVSGKLATIDYGGTLTELFSPSRTAGTLRAYSRHRSTTDVLKDPGEQDITSHVNFSELCRVGELMGLKTDALTTQEQFLTGIARDLWTQRPAWTSRQTRQFQTLTHPEHFGRPFRVLVQSR